MNDARKTIAVFDYDHTLITGDSMVAFLVSAVGRTRFVLGVALGSVAYFCDRSRGARYGLTPHDSYRTFLKADLLWRFLRGKKPQQFADAIKRLQSWQTFFDWTRNALLDHAAQGHHIVIASGGLSLYLRALLKDLPYDAIIATDIGMENGALTGFMIAGNCVRQRKAERLSDYLAAHGPFHDSWGYGNYPHDVPMMNLLKHRIIV